MYHILPKGKESIVGISFQEWIEAKDYKTLLPFLESVIQKQKIIRVFIDLRNSKGTSLMAALKIIPFLFKYNSLIEKKAFISDNPALNNLAKFMNVVSHTEARCFSSIETERAWQWVKK